MEDVLLPLLRLSNTSTSVILVMQSALFELRFTVADELEIATHLAAETETWQTREFCVGAEKISVFVEYA